MRLMELIGNPLDARIKDAVSVMLARSKTTGEPYAIDYDQLARMIDYPSEITKLDLESILNNDPELSKYLSKFDDDQIEIDSSGEGMMPPEGDMPPEDEMPVEMPPEGEMPVEMPPEGEMPAAEPAPEPEAAVPAAPTGPELVKKAADRATKRRGL